MTEKRTGKSERNIGPEAEQIREKGRSNASEAVESGIV